MVTLSQLQNNSVKIVTQICRFLCLSLVTALCQVQLPCFDSSGLLSCILTSSIRLNPCVSVHCSTKYQFNKQPTVLSLTQNMKSSNNFKQCYLSLTDLEQILEASLKKRKKIGMFTLACFVSLNNCHIYHWSLSNIIYLCSYDHAGFHFLFLLVLSASLMKA